ncbi:glutamate racemase [Sediminicola luteus]|uniref:Glutamate racemase n=1 Tax=Sediminicola luteus TaxID=319238 RepID=A0A2A4G6C8_9FLAO|nr:glutamate racemase [Sediminicola luteus]PCE63292.1 glutamate racemase [Sediminicola luteus]
MSQASIGIFDSGVGGMSITREIQSLLPKEQLLYLADSKNAPYGPKGDAAIRALANKNTEILLSKGCKMIVVACNTATTVAISELRSTYKVPFIGIEPAIKPAALQSHSGVVGVLATRGTLASSLFQNTSALHASGITVVEQEGNGLVPLIEAAAFDSLELKRLLSAYIAPMVEAQIDALVLGCTHYPYLKPLLNQLLPEHIQIIDSGMAVAKQTFRVLDEAGLLADQKVLDSEFYTNTDLDLLRKFMQISGCSGKTSFLDF